MDVKTNLASNETDKKFALANPLTVILGTVDVQQVLLCSMSFLSTFYKRKLAVHNICTISVLPISEA